MIKYSRYTDKEVNTDIIYEIMDVIKPAIIHVINGDESVGELKHKEVVNLIDAILLQVEVSLEGWSVGK